MSTEPARVPLVEVRDLMAPGQPLPFRVLDAMGRLLLGVGQVVADVAQLQLLLERGACVEYPEVEAVRQARRQAAGAAGLGPTIRKRTLFDRWADHSAALDGLLRTLGRDAAQLPRIEAVAAEHLALIDRHPDAALYLCIRQDDKRFAAYGLTHALHTATVAVLGARQLGWDAARVGCIARAALTMNVSILDLQGQMAEQPDPPNKRQLDLLRAHPAKSVQLLRDSGVSDAEWLAAVEDHHEQPQGTGYPRALTEVGEMARVLRAADVFMAKISPRLIRAPLLPQVAARQLFQQEAGGSIAAALIKSLGVYPPGDFVRLRNGEAAVVAQRAAAGQAVQVVALQTPSGKPVLGSPWRDTALAEYAITGPLGDRSGLPRVLPEAVYGLLDP